MFSMVPFSFAAETEVPEVTFEAKEITDNDILFDRAIRGINDDKTFITKAVAKDKQTGEEVKTYVHSTVQHLKTEKLKDGTEKKYYVAHTFALIKGVR